MRHESWDRIIQWIERQAVMFGGSVIDQDTNERLDWGQALCREAYGAGEAWKDACRSHADDESKPAPQEMLDAMKRWDKQWPEWVWFSGRSDAEARGL